jgi:hypothetical protein
MLASGSLLYLNFSHMAAKAAGLPTIIEPVTQILTQVLNITDSVSIANRRWSIHGDCSVIMICTRDSPVYLIFDHKVTQAVTLA